MNRQFMVMHAVALMVLAACQNPVNESMVAEKQKYPHDSHSFGRPNEVAITHLDLTLDADFNKEVLRGKASYQLERNAGNTLILDVRDLDIRTVILGAHEDDSLATFRIEKGNAHGDALHIELTESTEVVTIHYFTSASAAALLWLKPAQTHDKKSPFLFTQGQAILTRSWIPIQDSPSIRLTYNAKVRTPKGMMALMSAENPNEVSADGIYSFRMEQPIPPYLMALAVGTLSFAPIGERTGVYAEPGMLQKAAYEFEDMEKMLVAAEQLYGPYAWGRYDVVVLPPSFPFGGMENPRLTFATPTIIAGDKSLTSLIAHEMAHSWSGNLVTNATWDDFWLNEGFTVYFEKRIMEALYGRGYAEMLNVLGYQDLLATIEELGADSPDTHLKLKLEGRDPDEGLTDIAYEKGYLMLRWLEEQAGREMFDAFLRKYFETHAFQTMTTESFLAYADAHLLSQMQPKPDLSAWIYAPGLPVGHPVPHSEVFQRIDSLIGKWDAGELKLSAMPTDAWTTHEWLHFLRGLPTELGSERMAALDAAFGLSSTTNAELAAAWFEHVIRENYQPGFEALEQFLMHVGRRKFVKPLYEALAKDEVQLKWARQLYSFARPNYHAVTSSTVDVILGVKG